MAIISSYLDELFLRREHNRTIRHAEAAQQGITVLCVTFKTGFAKEAGNRMVFMADGMILEKGKPKEMFEHPTNENAASSLCA